MSQDQLAGLSDLDISYVNQIENGKRNPSLVVILRILDALNCSFDDLVEAGQGTPEPRRSDILRPGRG
jgi:transcriptional regulator with XRE-family HTH domain